MKSSFYTRAAVLTAAFLLAACDDGGGSFARGPGGGAGGGAGGGGGGAGGGGGGGGVTFEPDIARQLTDTADQLFDVEVGGDGDVMVFASNENPPTLNTNASRATQLFAANVTTGGIAQLTTNTGPTLGQFDISDNADSIVFVSSEDVTGDNPSLNANIFLSNAAGNSLTQVTRNTTIGNIDEFQISGDGNLIVFTTTIDLLGTNPTNDPQIFSIASDGTGLTQVTSDITSPIAMRLAEGSNRIVYLASEDPLGNNADGNRELFAIDADGANHIQLTDTLGVLNIVSPEISDDGSRVAFVSQRDITGDNADLMYEVFIAETDGSGITQVTNSNQPAGTFISGNPGDIDISGNGQYVAFGSSFNFTGENPGNEHTIYWAAADGSQIGQILRVGTVAASAPNLFAENVNLTDDGSTVLFQSTVNLNATATGDGIKIYQIARDLTVNP